MGLFNTIKDQFLEVIEYKPGKNQDIVYKYSRPFSENGEIKTGSKVLVRTGQVAVFFKGGQFADILEEGTHKLTTDNLPVLSKIMALPYLFNSPIKADLYFISLRQYTGGEWVTINPVIIRDKDFGVARVRAYGEFSFRVSDIETFVREVLGAQEKFETDDILDYLTSYINEIFATVIGEIEVSILDFAAQYEKISKVMQLKANIKAKNLGIEFTNINVESISVPEEVEKLIDEQTGIGMASQSMDEFLQYQSARAMREAANQPSGIAGIGASMVLGNQLAKNMSNSEPTKIKIKCPNCGSLNDEHDKFCNECGESLTKNGVKESKSEIVEEDKQEMPKENIYDKLREYKALLDDGTLTQEEYDIIKNKLLGI